MKKRCAPRRATLAFLGACAGVLAAGMALVGAAGRFVPGRQVTSHTALPVHNALGTESADVLFWPEEIWEEYSLTDAARQQENTGMVQLFAGPWLAMAGWDARENGGLPGTFWQVSARGSECFYARDVRFAEPLPGTEGPPRSLTAQVCAGRREGGLAVTCRVFADDGYRDLPEDWQETAVQRCREELRYLFNLSDDETRTGLYDFFQTLLDSRSLQLPSVRFDDEETELYWQDEGLWVADELLTELAFILQEGQADSIRLYYQADWQPSEDDDRELFPHQTLNATPMPGDAELAFLLSRLGLDVQVVPMGQQAMVLFSWPTGDLGVYYDPVLDCFSGFSLQF